MNYHKFTGLKYREGCGTGNSELTNVCISKCYPTQFPNACIQFISLILYLTVLKSGSKIGHTRLKSRCQQGCLKALEEKPFLDFPDPASTCNPWLMAPSSILKANNGWPNFSHMASTDTDSFASLFHI